MRKLIAWVLMYSLDGLLADEGTEYWQFCFGLPVDPADMKQKHHERRAQGRLLRVAEDGGVGQHHHCRW